MTEQTLRALAVAGAPSVVASPGLAEQVLSLKRRSERRHRIGACLALVGLAAGGAVAARSTGPSRFYETAIPSGSMAPTLRIGERLVADRTLSPTHDDVVQLTMSNGGSQGLAVKRIIGMPGDVISCPPGADGYCHAWQRNDQVLAEPWIGRDVMSAPGDPETAPGFFVDAGDRIVPFPAVTVTPGHLFLLGDNRDNSVDSRISDPVLQELSGVVGVGVEVIGTDGTRRSISGAPAHEAPGAGRSTDPVGPLPTSDSVVVVTTPTT